MPCQGMSEEITKLLKKSAHHDYWAFVLHPSSSILKTREHNVSKTGSVSILR
jgi:hypothetical protein